MEKDEVIEVLTQIKNIAFSIGNYCGVTNEKFGIIDLCNKGLSRLTGDDNEQKR